MRWGGGGKTGEAKMVMLTRSRLRWVGLVGLFLSVFSLATHFFLTKYTDFGGISDYPSSSSSSSYVTIFSWRPVLEKNADLSSNSPIYRRLWGPVLQLRPLHPHANPRTDYAAPSSQSTGFIFVRIQGGFHEIRTGISDAVAVARLLNATLVIPEILSATSTKGISSQFKSFAYLYNEEQFVAALAKDVNIVKTLPKNLKKARRKKAIPAFRVPKSASPHFYLHHVLPILRKHSVVELVVSDGGCLQAILPPNLEEYQRLRCRVSYHALKFRQEVQEVASTILNRLRAPGRPFIAYDPGLTREALAYHGCAELFQDVHTELIQHKRAWMIKRGIVGGNLSVNSAKRRLRGSCPLTPEEVGILLHAYGYPADTIIYISGGEVFGGQRILVPLHAMFENVVDRTSMSTNLEINKIYGLESELVVSPPSEPSSYFVETKVGAWNNAGPRPRPLPPPPARPKSYNVEGWWGWVAESDNEPESTVIELRMNAHKLLWEAIDYFVSVEADVFISGFDRDGKGRPNFSSLVMGHRLYQSASSVTYRLNRKEVANLMEDIRDNLYQANQTWLSSARKHLRKSLLNGLADAAKSKSLSFLSHPVPECSCSTSATVSDSRPWRLHPDLGDLKSCPAWMSDISNDTDSSSHWDAVSKEEEEIDDNLSSWSSGAFLRKPPIGESTNKELSSINSRSSDNESEVNGKEEPPMEDQEELEGGDK